jgi:hypothetical protein
MNWNSLHKWWMFDDPRSYGARQLMLGAAEGLRQNGCDVHVHDFDPQNPNADEQLKQSLFLYNPDIILLANHPSTLFWQNMGCDPLPCPTIVWVFDDPFIMGGESFGEQDIVWVADPSFIKGATLRGAKHTLFVPVAAPCEIHNEMQRKYEVPLAYVGASFRIKQAREQMGQHVAMYLDQIIEMKLQEPNRSFESLLESYLLGGTGKVQWSGQLGYYLYTESNRLHRLNYLQPLAELGLHLYGNDAWLGEINNTPLQKCFQGTIEPLHEYPSLIRSASINLNLRSMQGISAPVQRDFLMPAIGGFMLSSQRIEPDTDWQQWDSSNGYQLGEFMWSPSFHSTQEAVEMVRHYLDNPSERLEWIDGAQQCIQNHHTFAHRMQQAGELMNEMNIE